MTIIEEFSSKIKQIHFWYFNSIQFNSVYFNHKNNTKENMQKYMNQIKMLQMLCTLYNDEIGD